MTEEVDPTASMRVDDRNGERYVPPKPSGWSDPLTGTEQAQHVVLRGQPAGKGQAVRRPFERCDAGLQRRARRVATAGQLRIRLRKGSEQLLRRLLEAVRLVARDPSLDAVREDAAPV